MENKAIKNPRLTGEISELLNNGEDVVAILKRGTTIQIQIEGGKTVILSDIQFSDKDGTFLAKVRVK